MLKRIGAEESGEFKAVASGTLPSGQPVVVNADGTVSVVGVSSISQSIGTAATFNAGTSGNITAAYDSANNKFVVFYRDENNGNYGTCVVGTVSGTSISFGSEALIAGEVYASYFSATYDVAAGKVVVFYADPSNHTKCKVGTVSGTSVSFGSEVTVTSNTTYQVSAAYDTVNEKVVVAVERGTSAGQCFVGTVSGTSISFGSEVAFNSAQTTIYPNSLQYNPGSGKFVVAYRDRGNSNYGTAAVGTVSGTSISFGSEVVLNSANTQELVVSSDPTSSHVVVYYKDTGGSLDGEAVVGTVSGTSISFGSLTQYSAGEVNRQSAVYNVAAGKHVVFFPDQSDNTKGFFCEGTVSGTSVSFTSPVEYEAGTTIYPTGSVYIANEKVVVNAFADNSDSGKGKAIVVRNAYNATNITSENYIGMSRGVVTGEPAATGTAVSFESGTTTLSHVAFDSSNNKVVIAYVDSGDSDKGKAVVGTVSGTSISFGSIVTFEAGNTANVDCVFDSSNNKIVIVYQDNGDSGRGKGIVGTVSGTSISFGSPTQFNSGANNAYNIAAAFDSSNNKVVVAYRDNGNSDYGTAAVGTVSGTSISFGTPVVFQSSNSQQQSVVFDSSNNKTVIGYRDSGASDIGKAIVGTVSGTSISFGTAATFNNAETSQLVGTFDSSNNKVVFAYRDNGNSDQGTAIVGTISGTSISFGSEVIFNAANTQGTSAVFDTNVNKVVISYEDRGDSDKGKFIVGTVSGTSISFDTETTFSGSNAVFQTGAAFDSNANKVVIAYANDTDSSDRGEAIVTNIDSLTRAEVASGQAASMDIIGSVSDNQIGLTAGQQYFVQNDGTIGTTAATPSVLAGTAISATELVVKT